MNPCPKASPPNPRNLQIVTFQGKSNANVIEDAETGGVILGLLRWTHFNSEILVRGKEEMATHILA